MRPAATPSTLVVTSGNAGLATMTSRVDPEGARRMMEMLVNLYADRRLAVVREYVSNAVDATRVAGSTEPVEITAPTLLEPNFVVTDRGTGMSVEEVEATFLAFAASTKRDTNDLVGGLGVGAKSAWALTESFLVDTVTDGKRTLVRAARDLSHQVLLAGEPTDLPTGTTISVPVEVGTHADEWRRVVTEVATAHDPGAVMVDGKPVTSIAASPAQIGPVLCKRIRNGYGDSVMIRSGGTLFSSVPAISSRIQNVTKLSACVIELPIGSFDHTPSRESLVATDRTNAAVEAALAEFASEFAALEQRINTLAHTDVAAAVKLRHSVLGDVASYNVLPINFTLRVPEDTGSWTVGGRRSRGAWVRTTSVDRDEFAATHWGEELQRTVVVTGLPKGRALRAFATYLKSNHSSVRRVIAVPQGSTGVELTVIDPKHQPTGQTVTFDTTTTREIGTHTMHALIDQQAIVVTEGGDTVLVAATDPTFAAVRRYLMDERGQDFDRVRQMVTAIRVTVKEALADAVSVVDGTEADAQDQPYRIVHGDPVEEVLLATALRLTQQNADLAPLGAFLKRLERNPSPASRSQLFGWLKAGGFTITREGLILGYKSVRNDGLSAHAGKEPVTVVHQDGTTKTVTGHVPYPVGSTVWMPRNLVDDDRNSACSVGLHVGTYTYAQNFSQQMLVVLVDPADVVSVPVNHSAQKMRVCRLRVKAIHDGEQIADAVIEAIRTVPDFDASEEYASRPENEVRRPMFAVADFPRIDGWDDEDDDEWDDDEDEWDEEDEEEDDDVTDLDLDADSDSDSDDDGFTFYGDCGDYSGLGVRQ